MVRPITRSMKVARLDSDKELINAQKWGIWNSPIPFYRTKYGIPILININDEGEEISRSQFPEMKEGTIYIVSSLFRSGYDRIDLWQPGELVRDKQGQLIGYIGLSQ